MPFYQDNHISILNKDCRSMSELPDESVQMVCTSPPYWGLRKYSGEQELIWGGDKDCEHQWIIEQLEAEIRTGKGLAEWSAKNARGGAHKAGKVEKIVAVRGFCSLCGAWKGAYGLEPTPEMYIEHTIEILREIRRVLRKDGVVFWNIGDSYASQAGGYSDTGSRGKNDCISTKTRSAVLSSKCRQPPLGLKPKDLCLIPFHLAIVAQKDGWWVRSIIIWNKLNPMPESVNGWRWSKHRIRIDENGNRVTKGGRLVDCPGCSKCEANDGLWLYKGAWRPTESHEYIIMLTKSDQYYCDAEAVREPYSPTERWGGDTYKGAVKKGTHGEDGGLDRERSCFPGTGRNLRSVWTFPTTPFPSFKIDGEEIDHFAVFPEKLPELCIKAATPEVGCCNKCGAPWARVLEKKPSQFNIRVRDAKAGRATPEEGYKATQEEIERYPGNHPDPGYSRTVGWHPTCKCNAPRGPSLVLDPMMGAGTTLLVAKKLNRQAVGYELSMEYCWLALERNRQMGLDL